MSSTYHFSKKEMFSTLPGSTCRRCLSAISNSDLDQIFRVWDAAAVNSNSFLVFGFILIADFVSLLTGSAATGSPWPLLFLFLPAVFLDFAVAPPAALPGCCWLSVYRTTVNQWKQWNTIHTHRQNQWPQTIFGRACLKNMLSAKYRTPRHTSWPDLHDIWGNTISPSDHKVRGERTGELAVTVCKDTTPQARLTRLYDLCPRWICQWVPLQDTLNDGK